ncbi:DUF4334 domain-containing protein [Tsukamurella tyrosinosolvens]|uniref:GXWXG protein n=1 Tax=Tsukamurella tyrosinosolvens TaxID=57704 RepID=A0A1H4W6Z4_TSUTY|nr:DUF4334 domain-containing protein [Tsukamurella tyrosinosolvens]KXO99286.1 hypothetical protein AXK58_23390 [Tsukamurella tyrosinosolvens]KXP08040.1 hypothetical protein AXK59_01855 [Tsukamurella tyrosinosolvens]KZL97401.1 hypothetical protein AXX05_00030 [Tsukamurella tyrosinosolvens]MCA4996023.1 DUF4334 domain-containing protein [Tsukamurella tyrosinosolvens]MEC4612703.1 DUF4334 domain-containing protein [Tsukamurella tyrosinosolvens]
MTAERTVRGLIDEPRHSEPAELAGLFAQLEPVSIAFLLGDWRGGELPSGHPMDGSLGRARWYGKSFVSENDVQPLVCLDEHGEKFSNVALGKGEATLRLIDFDGTVTASMVYDGQPVIDHFAKVDDDTVMGVMTGKKLAAPYFYFYLERDTRPGPAGGCLADR